MAGFRIIYAFIDDLDEVFYIGECRDFYWRIEKHRRDVVNRQHLRVYRHIQSLKDAGRAVWAQVLAPVPDDGVYARLLEQLVIADIGLIEDGGTLLNSRRSNIGPQGFIEESIRRKSEAAKRQWQRDREKIIAAQNAGKAKPEAKERHRLAHVGLKHTEEQKIRIGEANKKAHAEGRHGGSSPEAVAKRSEKLRGQKRSEEQKATLASAQRQAWADGRYANRTLSDEGRERHRQACLKREERKRSARRAQPSEV